MLEDLQIRHYSPTTIRIYPLPQIARSTWSQTVCALRFFYTHTLSFPDRRFRPMSEPLAIRTEANRTLQRSPNVPEPSRLQHDRWIPRCLRSKDTVHCGVRASTQLTRAVSLDRKTMPRFFLLFAFGLGQTAAVACSCLTSGSACGALQGTQVVFVGRVIEDSGEGFGKGPAKMAVEEILHGLPKEVREITVETGAGTSCYMRLQKDERYVIYGTGTGSGRVARNFCSFSFQVAGNEALLAALREEEAQGKPRLAGKVQLRTSQFDAGGNGVGGVRVTAQGSGTKLDAMTSSNGEFEMQAVPIGKYHL